MSLISLLSEELFLVKHTICNRLRLRGCTHDFNYFKRRNFCGRSFKGQLNMFILAKKLIIRKNPNLILRKLITMEKKSTDLGITESD